MTQADGAMAILKQAFAGALSMQNLPTMLRSADEAYSPIMASYDPAAYRRLSDALVMDSDVAATPVLKGRLGWLTVELPRKRTRSPPAPAVGGEAGGLAKSPPSVLRKRNGRSRAGSRGDR